MRIFGHEPQNRAILDDDGDGGRHTSSAPIGPGEHMVSRGRQNPTLQDHLGSSVGADSYDPVMRINYNIPITVVRGSGPNEQRLPMDAMDLASSYALPVTADIQEGDRVEQVLPNGRTRTVYITKVDVLQSPFQGGSDLDHTDAYYSITPPAPPSDGGGTTWNVTATNVMVATGPHAHQTMTVGATTEHLVQLIKGIAELTVLSGAVQGNQDELERVRDEAITQVENKTPDAGAVQRFAEWVSARIKAGADAAVSKEVGAAINATVSALVQNAESLTRALGG